MVIWSPDEIKVKEQKSDEMLDDASLPFKSEEMQRDHDDDLKVHSGESWTSTSSWWTSESKVVTEEDVDDTRKNDLIQKHLNRFFPLMNMMMIMMWTALPGS